MKKIVMKFARIEFSVLAPRRAWAVSLLGFMVVLGGCAQLGPNLVQAGRNDYNKVLARSDQEEQLMNLVRMRYADSPLILDVSSVSTSFEWSQDLSAVGTAFDSAESDSGVGVSGSLGYREMPTVTYTPLGGADFVRNVMTPVPLDSFLLLGNSGWSIERLLRVMVNSMNGLSNARRASGPTPFEAPEYQDFKRAAKLLRALQLSGLATEGYAKRGSEEIPVIRFEAGFWETDEAKELASLIGLRPGQPFATLDTLSRRPRPDAVGLEMRSLAGIMFFLSHAVEVPKKDLEAGRVAITRQADGRPFDWSAVLGDLLVIKSASKEPMNAASAMFYRGSWFYIDDSDVQSKYTFMLLAQLTAIQAGEIERSAPVLTLPVGG
jgi:hypothetical protein